MGTTSRQKSRTRKEFHQTNSVSSSQGSSSRTGVPSRTTTFRRSQRCTWCFVCGGASSNVNAHEKHFVMASSQSHRDVCRQSQFLWNVALATTLCLMLCMMVSLQPRYWKCCCLADMRSVDTTASFQD